jgi:glycosyltransferase involved in cell wall biosynthesis
MPMYNPDCSVLKTIQSVLNQSHENLELIMVDDGSNIDIKYIVHQFSDIRIQFYSLEHKNANVARNYGIAQSKGKYIAFLDSDDIWLETHLEECIHILQETNVDGLYGSLILKYENSQEQPFYVRKLNDSEQMINYLLSTRYGAQTSTLFFTAESVKDILWNPTLNRHQDYDFVVRYSMKYQFTHKEKPTVIYTCNFNEKMIDFESCICFINKNINDIDPQLYNQYNFNMLIYAKNIKSSDDIIKHYISESTRYKEYLSYHNYISIRDPNNWFEKLKCKIEFLLHILKVRVE